MNAVGSNAPPPNWLRHELIRHESPVCCDGGVFESAVIAAQGDFNEALVSWNVDSPANAGFCVELRVGRQRDNYWTPYLYLGDWGPAPPAGPRVVECEAGRIDVDVFRSDERFDRTQYRFRALSAAGRSAELRIRRVVTCLSERTDVRRCPSAAAPTAAIQPGRLPVPFRSQLAADPALSARICSPTSLAMVLQYRGADLPIEVVAAACYDPTHDIYGNWPRNIQAAYSLGVPGYLARFLDWDTVAAMIAAGQPLIISVNFSDPGALTGAPYATTRGHLLVLCGFDARGDVHVNDPAAATARQGCTVYRRQELERVWLQASGGVAYVLLPPGQRD
jgi:hypothetical protein